MELGSLLVGGIKVGVGGGAGEAPKLGSVGDGAGVAGMEGVARGSVAGCGFGVWLEFQLAKLGSVGVGVGGWLGSVDDGQAVGAGCAELGSVVGDEDSQELAVGVVFDAIALSRPGIGLIGGSMTGSEEGDGAEG
jgi:hypothetical protein